MSIIFFVQVVLYFVELLSYQNRDFTTYKALDVVARKISWLSTSTGPSSRGLLGILALIVELYDNFVGYSGDLFFFLTVLFLRSLIVESISDIERVNLGTSNVASSCVTVR